MACASSPGAARRRQEPINLVCCFCGRGYGTTSLSIHQKSCVKKHAAGLESMLNNPQVTKVQGKKDRAKCADLPEPPTVPIPPQGSPMDKYWEFNDASSDVFAAHLEKCLWCRTSDAGDFMRELEERKRKEEEERQRLREAEEAERKRREEEERKRREEEERLRREAEEAERARLAAEEEAARKRREEEERRRREAEEAERRRLAAEEEERRRREEEERLRREAEDDEARRRREAEEAERGRLAAEKEEARRRAEEEEEEERRRRAMLNMQKKPFLKKGEGKRADTEAGTVASEAALAEEAKRALSEMSIAHARRAGKLHDAPQKAPEVGNKLVEMDEETEKRWHRQWTPEEEEAFAQAQEAVPAAKEAT